jgi:hypothetical protein
MWLGGRFHHGEYGKVALHSRLRPTDVIKDVADVGSGVIKDVADVGSSCDLHHS